MAKIFTPSTLLVATQKEKNTKLTDFEQELSMEPSNATIDFLLNYSKSLDVIHSKSVGLIDTIKN